MPIEILHHADRNYVELKLSGKLAKEDYHNFTPTIETLIQQHGALHMLVVLDDFHGWTMGALWEDTKFDIKHFKDIARLAIVGDSKWEEGMATFCKPFTKAKIKYFNIDDLALARTWIAEPA
ncbi:STAS/SEC14 domain-containing protein [Gimesia sp.]|uniref:STAS/SEC14 domain-containing protein n=1 Tax=Gimesia sp. TaxID=2024833 RepID=UPI000C5D8CC0|nr:STAS/SEC14 domain-containing protein [Gimesia sp.]MAX37174.1 STAS/SEC14 domain-containing protein [Gimesia sp.]HAH44508.1 STAS/SEC14 domain-containing protein [Planctomycetaceae bacterium]HBL43205.1 STAS/SEC14 domain-containing protein [Planctomycetaceae bacterium]|tara:strand:- start:9247 stop:9612 length:366 start_codon:yes stop_codon:yes gene_type:complete